MRPAGSNSSSVFECLFLLAKCIFICWLKYPYRCLAAPQVYPIGIPVLYAAILWKNRELLNPRIHTEPDVVDEAAAGADSFVTLSTTSKGQTKKNYSFEELQMLEEKVKARRTHPELVPSMFLWKDFGEISIGIPYVKVRSFGLVQKIFSKLADAFEGCFVWL